LNDEEYKKYLKEQYDEDYFRGKKQGLPDYSDIVKHWKMNVNRYIRFLRFRGLSEIIDHDYHLGSRIMIVGAGWGYELIFLDSIGFFEVYGIEPSEFAVKNFRKWCPFYLRERMFEKPAHEYELADDEEPYHIVFCHDVLEHIPPEMLDKTLASIKKMAAKHIVLTITTTLDEENLDADPTHTIKESPEWWARTLEEHFTLMHYETKMLDIIEGTTQVLWTVYHCRVDIDESESDV
jgi:2-polyprenyl-3-methyl-5-hydroxy-6-metoxy-1,4-benzoquinol methylase